MEKRIGVILTGNAAGVIRSFSAGQAAAVQFARESESAMARAASASKRYEASVQGTEAKVSASLAALKRTAGAALGGFSLMAGINAADDWGQYASRIRQATKSTEEYDHVQSRLVVSARNTFRALAETREGFIQTSPVLRDMGLSLDHSIDAIDTFSGLLVVNSASAEKGSSAMNAFSKSLNSGKTDADSWSSIMSAMPSIVDLLVVSTGRSAQEIRKLGADGKLSIQEIVQALVSGNASVMQAVADMPTTVKDAVGQIGNAFGEYIGRTNEARGVTAAMASSISYVADNFELLADAAVVAVGAGLVRYASGMMAAGSQTAWAALQARSKAAADLSLARAQVEQTKASLAQAVAMRDLGAVQANVTAKALAHEAATKRLAAAQAAYSGVGRSLLGILGGPVGIAATVGLGAAAWLAFSRGTDEARQSLLDIDQPLADRIAQFKELNNAQREGAILEAAAAQKDAAEQAEDAFGALLASMHSVNGFRTDWSVQQWVDFRSQIVAARQAGEDLTPIIKRAAEESGINPNVINSWLKQNANVATLDKQVVKLTGETSALRQEQDQLAASALNAASAQGALTAGLVATDEAGRRYLERLQGSSITAGLKTQREQLEALVKAGKMVYSDSDLDAARKAADIIDRANANKSGGSSSRVSEGQRYIEQLKERIALLGKEGEYEKLQAQISVGAIKFKSLAQRQAAEEAAKAADKANASAKLAEMQREIDMTGLLSDADRMRYEVSRGVYTGLSADIKESLVVRASELDATKRQTEVEKTLRDIQAERSLAERKFAREIEAFGRGDQYRGLMDSLSEVEDRYQRIMDGLRNSPSGLSDGQRAMWESVRNGELAAERSRYAQRLQLQEDWRLGASRSLENYRDTARDVAGGVEELFGNAFSGMEEALVTFARNGKLSFSDLADSIISDMMRIMIQQSITGPLAGMVGGAIGNLGFLNGGVSGLSAASAAQLSGGDGIGSLIASNGWSRGGYTGDGGRYDPAGLVHRGEGVLNQDEIRAIGGERGFNQLRRAIRGQRHALGGMAGRPAAPPYGGVGADSPSRDVNIYSTVHAAPGTNAAELDALLQQRNNELRMQIYEELQRGRVEV